MADGVVTGTNRIVKALTGRRLAADIKAAWQSGRVEKWLVHTDPQGSVSVTIDAKSKVFPRPDLATKIVQHKTPER